MGIRGTNPAPPARDGDDVVVGTQTGEVTCFDATSGQIRWVVRVEGPVTAPAVFWRDRVLVPCEDGYVYVFQR